MKILYLNNTSWEFDFIVKDILFNIENTEVEIFENESLKLFLNRNDIIENNIIIINTVCDINELIDVVKYIKPIVIFYLSDEFGSNKNITMLEKYTKILFRQYNHSHYNYSSNNYQLVLGYSKYFLNGKKSLSINTKKMSERIYNASFIGSLKSDRSHMSQVFKNNIPSTNIIFVNNNWDINNLPCSPEKCFDIYNNSIFVICGRGNISLDCFRIYEAIVSGAIPVIVGNSDEINITFNYNNNLPPFIYDESWEKVVIKCKNLLRNPEELQEIQNNLLSWWKNQIEFINHLIQIELH
jgi:hypothetical protein